ncbi:hypothetical protein INR49_007700 [Caranx melampygus]|nr:hypothetical protein INR49_007700 [Caranx melampygus]
MLPVAKPFLDSFYALQEFGETHVKTLRTLAWPAWDGGDCAPRPDSITHLLCRDTDLPVLAFSEHHRRDRTETYRSSGWISVLILDKVTSEIAGNRCQVQYQARAVTVRGLDPVHSSAGDEEEQEGEKTQNKTKKVND